MRHALLLPIIALLGCTTPEPPGPSQAELDAVRLVTLSGPRLSWEALRIHPGLMARACAVSTLVNVDGEVVGYCRGGRQCRTNDWRPVATGCEQAPEYRAGPATPATPAPGATPPAGGSTDFARVR
jgi:hypothetical protein